MRAKSLTGPLIGLYAVKTLLVAAIFVSLLVSLVTLERDNTTTHSASNLLIGALSTERSSVDLQNGVRGYLLTGNASFLAPYQSARTSLPSELRTLRQDAQSRGQLRLIERIQAGIEDYEATVAAPALRVGPGISAGRSMALTNRGNRIVEQLRARFRRLDAAVVALRSARRASATGIVTRSIVIAAGGLALSLALELGLASFLLRGILRPVRTVSRAAARIGRGELSVRVPRTGPGELGTLADSFNRMAASTQARTDELAGAQERLAQAVATAEGASAMKSNFVANMSHEIRTPLNGLVGMLALLSESELAEEQRKYVEIALSSSDALLAVVDDVLDLAKIEAGRLELECLEFDLHETVEWVCELMAAAARAKRLDLQAQIREDVPRVVRGDRTRVGQVLQNLVSNAVKFTAAGSVEVEVARVPGEAELRIRFEVRDTGIGIEHERVSELFEPFVQAEAGTTREFGGTGLGLTISRDLTELMGGSIAAEGRLGDGSTFSCELPFEPVGALVATPVPDPGLAGIRALVADPSATTRRTLVAYASAWGMRASDCASAPAAIEALRVAAAAGEPYGVVLLDRELDLQLPAGPGDPPVILLSTSAAWPSPDTHGRLTKPVRRTALLNAISTAVGLGEPALDSVQRRDSQPEVAARRAGLGARPGVTEDERPLRVLVAEDHDVNWLVIERMLASRGHRAVRARDGHAVLELASEGVYDLALMDIQMPGRDGFDTARELRRRELGPLPIVAMTASAMTGTREACLAAGMDDYVTKPISSGVLDEILGHWCVPGAGARPADTPLAGTRRADLRLDPTRLDQLRRLLPASEMRLRIDEMAGDVDRDLRQLATAVAAQDQARAAEAAHRIRNTGRLIGAEELVVAAAAFDHPPRPDRPAVTLDPDALELLNASWVETREALAGAIASLPATQA